MGQNNRYGTHRTRASPAERKGRDIEEQADSWELEHNPRSCRSIHVDITCITEHPSVYLACIALYHVPTNSEQLNLVC